MASSIDPTVPTSGNATTASVRANFDAAKTEIEALQAKTENVTTITAYAATLLDDATAADARTTLGTVIGTDVQAYDAGLADIAGLATTDGNFIVGNGPNWVAESGATARTSLGLGSIATQDATNVNIDGGTIDGTAIGVTTRAAGNFTLIGIGGSTPNITLTDTDTNVSHQIRADSGTGLLQFTLDTTSVGSAPGFVMSIRGTERLRMATDGTLSLGATPGAESLRVVPVASSVNYIDARGAVTLGIPGFRAEGADTSVSIGYRTKGAGSHFFYSDSGAAAQFSVSRTANAANRIDATGAATGDRPTLSAQGADTNIGLSITAKGTGNITFGSDAQFTTLTATTQINTPIASSNAASALSLATSGGTQVTIGHIANAVNTFRFQGAVTGSFPGMFVDGADTNIGVGYRSKGTGPHFFYTQNGAAPQFGILNVTGAVDYICAEGSSAGSPRFLALGASTDIDIRFSPKGAGNVAITLANVPDFADDAAASAGGVPLGGIYRTASVLKIRVT